MNLKPNEKWLILILFWMLVFYVFNVYIMRPTYRRIDALKNEITEKKVSLELANKRYQALRLIKGDTAEVKKKGQEEIAVEFISYLTKNIARSKLTLVSMKPEYGERVIKQAKVMYFNFIVEGSYNQVYKLLISLEDFPNLTTVDFLKIKKKDKKEITASVKVAAYY